MNLRITNIFNNINYLIISFFFLIENIFFLNLDDDIHDDPTLLLYKIYWALNIIGTDIAFGITFLYWTVIYDGKI